MFYYISSYFFYFGYRVWHAVSIQNYQERIKGKSFNFWNMLDIKHFCHLCGDSRMYLSGSQHFWDNLILSFFLSWCSKLVVLELACLGRCKHHFSRKSEEAVQCPLWVTSSQAWTSMVFTVDLPGVSAFISFLMAHKLCLGSSSGLT